MERPCIGSFLVDDDGNHGTTSDFESHLSLLQQLSNDWNRPRLLLEGPAPIASSLILDVGMSLASNEPCRCGSRVHQQCENCVAVAILRPFDEPALDTFPMLCLPRNGNPEDTSSLLFHRKQALQRIQINRFANSHDLLHYLLTMAGRPIHQLPMAGIFIDQLDRIIGMEEDPSEDATSDAMRKSQIIAVLLDTTSLLERRYGRSLMIFVSVSDQSKPSLIPLQSFSSFWSPLCLEIVRIDFDKQSTSDKGESEQVLEKFVLYCSLEQDPVAKIFVLRSGNSERYLICTLT